MTMARVFRLDVVLGATSLILALVVWIVKRKSIPRGLRLPPGPQRTPIVGNAGDMPNHHHWETYTRWAKEYGDLVYIKVLGRSIIFVNSINLAHDLFDTRSSLYSDRCRFIMLGELAGFDWGFGLMPYGESWRRHRKAFHQGFHPTAVATYNEIQIKHARDLLQRLHENPDIPTHMRHFSGAVIMEIIYGIKVLPTADPYIECAEKAFGAAVEAANPGVFLVDILPALRYVPEWVPGAGFQKKARMWRTISDEIRNLPFVAVKQAMKEGTAGPSLAANLLEQLASEDNPPSDGEDLIRDAMAQAYGAGVDSVVSSLTTFILAMILYPEAQRKAQAELDDVVGMDRLPTFEDQPSLPYINALCKEVLRWHPVAPIGNPHRLIRDDVYEGYFLPGGSMVIGNIWAMSRDEKVYGPQTEDFIPERFLKPGVKDPAETFGFGRRVCPGRHKAENSLFIAITSILKVFDISHAKNKDGTEIPVEPLFTSGFVSHPEPFKCELKLHSERAESLIWDSP